MRLPFSILIALAFVGCALLPAAPPKTQNVIARSGTPLTFTFGENQGASGYNILIQPQSSSKAVGNLKILVRNVGKTSLTARTVRMPMGSARTKADYLKPGDSFELYQGSASDFFSNWREIIVDSPGEKGFLKIKVQLLFTGSDADIPLTIQSAHNPRGIF